MDILNGCLKVAKSFCFKKDSKTGAIQITAWCRLTLSLLRSTSLSPPSAQRGYLKKGISLPSLPQSGREGSPAMTG